MARGLSSLVRIRDTLFSSFALANGAFPDLRLLQWNPHWQCFAWNTNNCSAEAAATLPMLLEESDIDFANVIEFEAPGWSPPENWTSIDSTCGIDLVDLIYNNVRWELSGPGEKGCMVEAMNETKRDRPYLIQQFINTNTSEGVIVIGAHFPHPASFTVSTFKEAEVLKGALKRVLNATDVQKVVLIADTNEWTSVSSESLMSYLGAPGDTVVSSSLERTCCFDNDFAAWGAFDRIVANFGAEMETEVLFDPLPLWAHEVKNVSDPASRRGAFHKAVRCVLLMTGTGRRHRLMGRIGMLTLGIAVGVCFGGMLAFSWYATSDSKEGESDEDQETGPSDSDTDNSK